MNSVTRTQLRMLHNFRRAYEERDYETLAVLASRGRRDRDAARAALEAVRRRPGWSTWLSSMAGDSRLAAVSRLLD